MKPSRNKVFCQDCERAKILFETEKKADNFIKFNAEEIAVESGYGPQRSYYCLFCGGWHITSIKDKIGISRKEQVFEQYEQDNIIDIQKLKHLRQNLDNLNIVKKQNGLKKVNIILDNQARRNKVKEALERQIEKLDISQIENFFTENIKELNKGIELLLFSDSSFDKQLLKELRQTLEILYIVKKQNRFQKVNTKLDHQAKLNKVKEDWERQIEKLDLSQKEKFFTENTNKLNKEIEQILNSESSINKQRLKDLRKNLVILNIVKKQNGFQKANLKLEKRIMEAKEKKIEEWRQWSKNLGYK